MSKLGGERDSVQEPIINYAVSEPSAEYRAPDGSKIIVETKSAHKLDGMAEALDQIRRYHVETPPGEGAENRTRAILYELLHLKYPNHGRMFTAILNAHLTAQRASIR